MALKSHYLSLVVTFGTGCPMARKYMYPCVFLRVKQRESHGSLTLTHSDDWLRLEAHPKEVVVLWASRHGNPETTGTVSRPEKAKVPGQLF